ncbi:MAG: FAD-dependent oxidoreductase [Planctomycetota bacterium]|nr:MAG: FAD-dependent oxidoreductase [Planctomycetota bacterium]
MGRRIAVIGGGVAGCAVAWAAARRGAELRLYEASDALGGVARQGDHRSLCGLAAIDAAQPELLEPDLSAPWLAQVATGAPQRRGRVWLWPSHGQALAAGLDRLCAHAGVKIQLGSSLKSLGRHGQGYVLNLSDGSWLADDLVDASGGGEVAAMLDLAQRSAGQWGALRGTIALAPDLVTAWCDPQQRPALLRRLYRALGKEGAQPPALSLEPADQGLWQLGVDAASWSEVALAKWQVAAQALEARVVQGPQEFVSRDGGGHAGELSLDQLFAQEQRGLCWLAWPYEWHDAGGVRWRWPSRAFYGLPPTVLQPYADHPQFYAIGRGMAVSPAAAAALRVTGSAWHIGAALGQRLGNQGERKTGAQILRVSQ